MLLVGLTKSSKLPKIMHYRKKEKRKMITSECNNSFVDMAYVQCSNSLDMLGFEHVSKTCPILNTCQNLNVSSALMHLTQA